MTQPETLAARERAAVTRVLFWTALGALVYLSAASFIFWSLPWQWQWELVTRFLLLLFAWMFGWTAFCFPRRAASLDHSPTATHD